MKDEMDVEAIVGDNLDKGSTNQKKKNAKCEKNLKKRF